MSKRTITLLTTAALLAAAPAAGAQSLDGYAPVPGTSVQGTGDTPPPSGTLTQETLPANAGQDQGGVLGDRDQGEAPAASAGAPDESGVLGDRDSGAAPGARGSNGTAPLSAATASPKSTAAAAQQGGSLPFTGMSLLWIAIGGSLLMAAGYGLMHVNRKPSA